MLRKLLIVLVSGLISTILATSAFSWGSVTHLYIAEQVNHYIRNDLKLQNMYGAMAPDINALAPSEIQADLRYATHYDYQSVVNKAWRLPQRAFAAGWTTHNEVWGADYYAHVDPGYVIDEKNDQLVAVFLEEFPDLDVPEYVLKSAAENYIEVGIDLLLQEHDRWLGIKVMRAASKRDESIPLLLARAYPEFVGKGLLVIEAAFQRGMIAYGAAIALRVPKDRESMAFGLAVLTKAMFGEEVTPEQSLYFLETAMDLCKEDYFSAIEDVIGSMTARSKLAPVRLELEPGSATLWGQIKKTQ